MKIAVLDIGGTNIKSGLWENGILSQQRETPTPNFQGRCLILERVKEILQAYEGYDAIGISTAGQVDTAKGLILYANENILGYTGTRVKDTLEAWFHVPVAVQNDVNCAALGEGYFGAGRGTKDFLCLTYGTGIGGGIIINGTVYGGAGYAAGEFGCIVTHPEQRKERGDFLSGCYERYASTTALVNKVSAYYPHLQDGRAIVNAWRQGMENNCYEKLDELMNDWIQEIGLGLVSLIHIFNPSLVILGGGIMEQEQILERIRVYLQENLLPTFCKVRIQKAQLGNQAGMYGAAVEAIKLLK